MYLTRKELQEYGFQKGDTEGFVNYGLSIIGVKMSAFFMEDRLSIAAVTLDANEVTTNEEGIKSYWEKNKSNYLR